MQSFFLFLKQNGNELSVYENFILSKCKFLCRDYFVFFCLFFYNKDYNFLIILTNEFQNPFHMFCLQNFNICSKNWSEEFNLISKKKEKNI